MMVKWPDCQSREAVGQEISRDIGEPLRHGPLSTGFPTSEYEVIRDKVVREVGGGYCIAGVNHQSHHTSFALLGTIQAESISTIGGAASSQTARDRCFSLSEMSRRPSWIVSSA